MHLAELTGPVAQAAASTSVTAAQAGDTRAFESLYREHVGMVYGLCLRMAANRTEAEQLTQDAFVRAWRKIGTFRGTGAFGAWLRRLTINVVIEHRRREARDPHWLTADLDAEPGGFDLRRDPSRDTPVEIAIDLERAIGKLPTGARTVFVLHDVEGYRHDEIAAMTGTAVGTTKAQLHRARRLLRQALKTRR